MNKLLIMLPGTLLLAGCATMDGGMQSSQTSTTVVANATPATPPQMASADEDTVGAAQFPTHRPATGKKVVVFDPNIPAWAAYDAQGDRVKTGRASGGRDYCPDIKRGCRTVTGTYTIYRKGGPECKSTRYPLPNGGAPTPYCMHFYKGYALHGSYDVPSHNASHGCVRLLPSAAQWLSQDFVDIGTTVVIKPYAS